MDGIRGLAILLVLVWHYFANHVQPEPGTWLFALRFCANLTWSGVDLFFVLSGFLLGGILLDNHGSPNYFKAFYARRALRILPIYFLLVAGFVAASVWLQPGLGNTGIDYLMGKPMPLWSYLSFTQNFAMAAARDFGASMLSVTWSLAIEEQFYLFLPLLLRWIPRTQLPGVLILLIALAPACRLGLWIFCEDPALLGFVLMPARADALLLGVLASLLVREKQFIAYLETKSRNFYLSLLVLFCGVALMTRFLASSPLILVVGHTWLALFYTALILLVVKNPRGVLGTLMRNRALRSLGVISYAVYLFHIPALGLMFTLIRGRHPQIQVSSDGFIILGALALTMGLAVLSWHAIEKPLLRLSRRFTYQ